jgi:hypothetical protein
LICIFGTKIGSDEFADWVVFSKRRMCDDLLWLIYVDRGGSPAVVEKREYGRQIKQIVRTIIDFSESDCLIKT